MFSASEIDRSRLYHAASAAAAAAGVCQERTVIRVNVDNAPTTFAETRAHYNRLDSCLVKAALSVNETRCNNDIATHSSTLHCLLAGTNVSAS